MRAKLLLSLLLIVILLGSITYLVMAVEEEEEEEEPFTCYYGDDEGVCSVRNCKDEMDALGLDEDLCSFVIENNNIIRFPLEELVDADGNLLETTLPFSHEEGDQQDAITVNDVHCANPLAVRIAWLTKDSGDWKVIAPEEMAAAYYVDENGDPVEETAVTDKVSVSIVPASATEFKEELGRAEPGDAFYLAVIEARFPYTDQNYCIKTRCPTGSSFYTEDTHPDPEAPGYTSDLLSDSKLIKGTSITFRVCPPLGKCNAKNDGVCDPACPQGIDADCTMRCTSIVGDCCDLSQNEICDPDCPQSDPDCLCTEELDGCCKVSDEPDPDCPNYAVRGGELERTKEPGDSCKMAMDGVCDTDCANYSIWGTVYDEEVIVSRVLDVDCCSSRKISGKIGTFEGYEAATSATDGCCLPSCDGVCDADCLIGEDPDCEPTSKFREVAYLHPGGCVSCGNGVCDYGAYRESDDIEAELIWLLNNQFENFTKVIARIQEDLASKGIELQTMENDTSGLIDEVSDALTGLNEDPDNCHDDCGDTCGNGHCEPWEKDDAENSCDVDACAVFESCLLKLNHRDCEEMFAEGMPGVWSFPT